MLAMLKPEIQEIKAIHGQSNIIVFWGRSLAVQQQYSDKVDLNNYIYIPILTSINGIGIWQNCYIYILFQIRGRFNSRSNVYFDSEDVVL